MAEIGDLLTANLEAVRADIRDACERCGRRPESVRLVAVTKYARDEWVNALSSLYRVFGENRPQQLSERRSQHGDCEWHLIGQLQRNKARSALLNADWIHSVDSRRLLERLSRQKEECGASAKFLLQVNLTRESSKSGFAPEDLLASWGELAELCDSANWGPSGLMTMGRAGDSREGWRETFSAARRLRDRLADHPASRERNWLLPELSMGMSGDFREAITEGATIIRVGSRLFAGLEA